MATPNKFSRRERQIMDVLYERKEASAQEVLDGMEDPPSYSSVRALLARLLEKGAVTHRQEGAKYIYAPAVAVDDARESAVKRLVNTFFEGSALQAVNALLGGKENQLSDSELDELEQAIAQARSKTKVSRKDDNTSS
ncbi:BlaI/MecI/CopY family transcriptional regulator [Maricurvus nonylphenolicus]|uniref:BlaI/MecI/CopY family transcriptional regulator n=1 Tax=Maricurvus nonylphenolicus TaxID=1008307 RepID=UPI0036F41E41